MSLNDQRKHDVFDAIADPTRRQLLALVADGGENVSSLTSHFSVSRPAISKHLRVLREANLITEERHGRETIYRLNPGPLYEVRDWLAYYERFWNDKVENLMQLFGPKH